VTYVVGLTGSIGTGKSTVARMFRLLSIPVFDADGAVSDIYKNNHDFKTAMKESYPQYMLESGAIDKPTISKDAFYNKDLISWLECELHPIIRTKVLEFIAFHSIGSAPIIILDIPLLFERSYDPICDAVLVAACDSHVQLNRVISRSGMSSEKLEMILAQQMPQANKINRATWVIYTNGTKVETFKQIKDIILKKCNNL
jgi:dephospho-CoA kinase